MNRRGRFIPSFDHLGLRITPSDIVPSSAGSDIVANADTGDGLGIPGGESTVSESITFILPGFEEQQTELLNEAILTNVDWILPTG